MKRDEDLERLREAWAHLSKWDRRRLIYAARWFAFRARAERVYLRLCFAWIPVELREEMLGIVRTDEGLTK